MNDIAVKGKPQIMFRQQAINARSDERVYCGEFNAVHIEVYVSGASPSATITVLGAGERGGNYLALPDINATQTAVTSSQSFDVVVGERWATVELSSLTAGTFTIWMTPYVSAGQSRVSASISVATLAAIQANLGAVHIDGVVDISADGGIFQGTGTFAVPTTGLKIWNESGIGRIAGYTAGALQWYANTDGKLYIAGGSIVFDANAISVGSNPAGAGFVRVQNNQAIVWRNGAGTGDIEGIKVDANNNLAVGTGLDMNNQQILNIDLLRLRNISAIMGRNFADNGNVAIAYVNASDIVYMDGPIQIKGRVGFYDTVPASKQTITGSRGGNAALASLLTGLAAIGLITDSSS